MIDEEVAHKRWTLEELTSIMEAYNELERAAEEAAYEYCSENGLRVGGISIDYIDFTGNPKYGEVGFTRRCRDDVSFNSPGWPGEKREHQHSFSIKRLLKPGSNSKPQDVHQDESLRQWVNRILDEDKK